MSPPAFTVASRTTVLNPLTSAFTEYSPARSAGALYAPVALVTAVRRPLSALFVMVTVAFGTTAPDESVTVPSIIPFADWAQTVALKSVSDKLNNSDKDVSLAILLLTEM